MAITEQQAKEVLDQWSRDEHLREQGQQDAVRAAENELLSEEGIDMAEYKRRRAAIPRLQITTDRPIDELSQRDYKLARQRQRRPYAPERLPDTLQEYKEKLKQG